MVTGSARYAGRTAFLFIGHGAQYPGMGRGLHSSFPAFADAFDSVCAAFAAPLGASLADIVFAEDAGLLDRTEYAQAALFAVEVAVVRLLESCGLRPDVLLGHSIGELATASQVSAPGYWVRQAREGVRFHDAVRYLERMEARTLIEVGPDGLLAAMAGEALTDPSQTFLTATLGRGRDDQRMLLTALAGLHVHGTSLDFGDLLRGRRVDLPRYAFQRRRYWAERTSGRPADQGQPQDGTIGWHYETSWTERAEAALPAPAGTWVLARCEGSADSWTAALAAALKRRGARVATLEVSPADNRASLASRLTALSLPADATVVSLAAGRASLIPAIPTAARLGSGTT